MKQTAVEWLVEQIFGNHTSEWKQQIEQAKGIERMQKAEEYLKGFNDGKDYQIKINELTFKQE